MKTGKLCGAKVLASEKSDEATLQDVAAESNRDPDEFLQFVDAIIRIQKAHSGSAEPHHDPNNFILRLVNATFQMQETNPTLKREQMAQNLRSILQIDRQGMTFDINNTENMQQWEEDAEKEESRSMDEIFGPNSTLSKVEPPPQYERLGGPEQPSHPPMVERFPNTGYDPSFRQSQPYQTAGYDEHAEISMTSLQLTYPGDNYMDSIDPALGISASSTQPMTSPHNPPAARQLSGVNYPNYPIFNYNPRVIDLINAANGTDGTE